MKELEEVSCEIRRVVDIQHSIVSYSNSTEGDSSGLLNSSQACNSFDGVNGGFLNDTMYGWLSYGSHLIIINTKTGESTSSWTFRGRITCVCQFPTQCGQLPLLLVGLDNEASRVKDSVGFLCIFDYTSSRVLRAIRMPAGVEQVCIVSSGAEWEEFNDKRPDNILMQMDGIACVVLRNLQHLMIDLQRSNWEDLDVVMDENFPAEIEFLTTKGSFHRDDGKHMAFNLLNRRIETHIGFNREDFESTTFLDEKLTNTIISSTKIGCLISGCLGRVIIWQNDGSIGWISQPINDTMVVTHFALLEPTDDPRPFYYLWVVFQDESSKVPPLLRMFALLFERKFYDRGTNLYFNLEAEPSLKFEFELQSKDIVVSLSTIERSSNPDQTESESRKGEDSLLLISTTNKVLLFDLNQWYKEQMPQTVSQCKNPNSILACCNTKHRPSFSNEIISCAYIPCSLQEFPNSSLSSSEELFFPNSLSLEWIELSVSKVTFWLSRGVQAELLREMALTGPIILTQPTEMFHKCLSVGLVPFNTEVTFSSDLNAQKDTLLSLCLEQRWATFLIRCAKEWSDGSAAYMYPSFLKWGIQRASSIKMIADRLCVPLFDQSGSNIGESEVKTLRFCYHQLECLSNVVAKLPIETSGLIKQRRALKRVSLYFQVLLWFYDVDLLPESQNLEEGPLPISLALKIPYPFEKLSSLYKEKRDDNKPREENEELLFIDQLIARECPALNLQWEREAGDVESNGYYPPPSLQSLLRSYLTECDQSESNEIEYKHQITIYLLMDLAMLLQGSYPGVDQLIKYPSSFKISPSLIKLTQAFWLLDHEDYQGFLDMMTGQLVNDSDVKNWHHKLILKTLIRNNQHKLALMYLRIKKPPLSSLQEQSMLIDLSVEYGLVQSAFHCRPQSHYSQLLTCFFQACKNYEKLGDIVHLALEPEEEELFVKFLEDSKSEDVRLLYYLQRCRYMEANGGNSVVGLKNMHVDILNAYNTTLPDIMKRFSLNMAKTNLDTGLEPRYPRPMTHYKSFQKNSNIYETVIRKARETFVRNEKTVIPFVSAPCAALRTNSERISVNCVMSPQIVTGRKRTLEQVDEDSGVRTPDRSKRRKLLDDGEAVLSAALSTPLVTRKMSNSKNTPVEAPQSILKIRQLIRNSTSPSLQGEDSPKANRQIRFDMSDSKEEEVSKSDETYASSTAGEAMSLTETAVLSDSSYNCVNVYTARPRPSLRRSYLKTPTESPVKCSGPGSSQNSYLSDSSMQNCFLKSQVRPCTSSMQSTAILSPTSSLESGEIDLQIYLKKPQNIQLVASTPLMKNASERELPRISRESSTEVEENISEAPSNNLNREESKYRNGDLSKQPVEEEEEEEFERKQPVEEEEEEEEFESFSNVSQSTAISEKKERWKFEKPEDVNLNGEHFDITDDESSDSGDEMVLALEEKEEIVLDAQNITDDESNDSVRKSEESTPSKSRFFATEEQTVEEKEKSIRLDNNNSSYRKTRKNSVRDTPERTEANEAVGSSEGRVTRSRRSSVSKEMPPSSPSKLLPKTPRTRRASSLMKEVLIATAASVDETPKISINSEESGASPRKTRGKRASSVAKDVEISRRTTRQSASKEAKAVKPLTKNSRTLSSSNLAEDDEEKVRSSKKNFNLVEDDKEKTKSPKTKKSSSLEDDKSPKTKKSSSLEDDKSSKTKKRSTKSTKEEAEVKPTRRRGSSVPKETVSTVRTRRASSLAKDFVVKEEVKELVNSPASNTRSRRSSIQSIPEELEEILSVPSKERVSAANRKKQVAQSSRQRRAASVELSQANTKRRTRNTSNRDVVRETIIEEDTLETEDSSSTKVSAKRKFAALETPVLQEDKATKPSRSRKTKQDLKEKRVEQFSFSPPDKTNDPPVDQKAIGEVPKYMFSPPHTRSKTTRE